MNEQEKMAAVLAELGIDAELAKDVVQAKANKEKESDKAVVQENISTQDIKSDTPEKLTLGLSANLIKQAQEHDSLPDGKYESRIKNYEFKNTQGKDGKPIRPMFVLKIQVESGEFENRLEWLNFVYGSDEEWALRNTKKMLNTLESFGVDVSSETTINNTIDEKILDKKATLTIKTTRSKETGKEFRNVSVSPYKI